MKRDAEFFADELVRKMSRALEAHDAVGVHFRSCDDCCHVNEDGSCDCGMCDEYDRLSDLSFDAIEVALAAYRMELHRAMRGRRAEVGTTTEGG